MERITQKAFIDKLTDRKSIFYGSYWNRKESDIFEGEMLDKIEEAIDRLKDCMVTSAEKRTACKYADGLKFSNGSRLTVKGKHCYEHKGFLIVGDNNNLVVYRLA